MEREWVQRYAKGFGFVNEIIYESRSGELVRAGFIFKHGDQVRGFYPALLHWMSARDARCAPERDIPDGVIGWATEDQLRLASC